jgi:hypothetical protein
MKIKNLLGPLLLVVILSFATFAEAQCPMCRGAVEGALKDEGNTIGLGLNKGILYLLATPYLAVAIVGGAWFYNKKKKA